jgi:streptogramin lyase
VFKKLEGAGVLAGLALILSACSGGGGTHNASVVPGGAAPNGGARAPRTVGAQTSYTPPTTVNSPSANLGQISGGFDGNLYFAEASVATNCTGGGCSGRISQITTGGSITSYGLPNYFDANNNGFPVYPFAVWPDSNNKIWFLSADGYFGYINSDGSSPTIYTLRQLGSDTNGTFTSMTQGSDGNFYVAETSPERVIKVTTTGTASVFSSGLSSGANVGMIMFNSDSNFWATERGTGKIAKINGSSGSVTEYDAVSGGGYNPLDMFSDGSNLWYTAQASGGTAMKLAEMSTSGTVVKTISITSSPSGEGALAPQGGTYAWTINDNISRVNRSTSVVNDYTLTNGDPGTVIEGLTIGSDGNLWYTDRAHNKVVKVSHN